jgi:acyl-coenzyme A thioesterase PaaI-like protein
MSELSLQERFAPQSACFGCGPANQQGLRVRSFPCDPNKFTVVGQADQDAGGLRSEAFRAVTEAEWRPSPHHEAFPGMLNGGIIGSLLDCHSNWTAAYQLMRDRGEVHPPCTVTSEFKVKLLRPTPSAAPLRLEARVLESQGSRVVVEAQLLSGGELCATCLGTFVAVKPGHPAYHRW